MSVLDELRETIDSHAPYERADQPDWHTVKSVLQAIDAFEAAHPTLHEAGDCWEVFDDTDCATGEDYRGIRQRYPACATAA